MGLTNLSPEKRTLLAFRAMSLNTEKGVQASRITPMPRTGPLPLSFAQQRLWFLNELEPNNPAYSMQRAYRVGGRLDVPALKKSVDEVIRRHEILRTTFAMMDEQPVQVIAPVLSLPLPVVDLRDVPKQREAKAQQMLVKEAQGPFDLCRGPLLRATLLRLGEEEYIFVVTMHHIISDGWSMTIFFRELKLLYEALLAGKPSPLPELAIQYADFAVWQRRWLTGQVLEGQLSYWKEQIGPRPPVLELPTDRPRPAVQTYRGASESLELTRILTEKIKNLSKKEGVTVFMTLLAVFKTLLHRLTGQDDISVGSPIANRNRNEIQGLIGFFVNTLVLRANLSGNPTFRQLLNRIRKVTLGAYAHQDLPFERLVKELRPERDLSRSPLFQVFFNMLDYDYGQFELRELSVERIPLLDVTSKFDLTLYAKEQDERLELRLVYNTDLFERDRMIELLEQVRQLTVQIVERPDARTAHFSMLTPRARFVLPDPSQSLRSEWEPSVHGRFCQQAGRTGENVAISYAHEAWSYAELDAWSNKLANYLRADGVQPREVVAIYGDRSPTLVLAILGILKAGAAFVVLDPAYPGLRLADSLDIVRPAGWIELEAADEPCDMLASLAASIPCRIRLPRDISTALNGVLRGYSTEEPEVTIAPDDLAYAALTSGSTGRPNAVMGGHGPLSHFLQWHCQTFKFSESDRFSMLSGLSHDPLLRDIFTPLWIGATLCIPERADMETSDQLARWVRTERITVVHLTPAVGQVMAEAKFGAANTNGRITSLRYIFFGGDVLRKHDVERIRVLAPNVSCVNFYGATETPQAMGYFEVPRFDDGAKKNEPTSLRENIPLGRGIKDVELLVLNAEHQPAGVGELGQIYVRTAYLAQGYMNDEELTKKRFMADPFSNESEIRLYRTGDLARYLPDGNVEFVGRADRQVKIRGFRIELGEIEAALCRHKGIKACVAVCYSEQEDKKLVAYFVSAEAISSLALRRYLRDILPEYMIPSQFIQCDSIALTPNGKIDYAPLDSLRDSQMIRRTGHVAPKGPVEKAIAEIWQNLLGVERVGLNDNFFDLGGHSLVVIRAIAMLERKLKLRVTFRDFINQTLGQFAAGCEQAMAETNG